MTDNIKALEDQLMQLRTQLAEAKRKRGLQPIANYTLQTRQGKITLSELFGSHSDLLLVHNMGTGCRYCTLWADGFVGLLPHLSNRAAFVLSSMDPPEVQEKFAASRNWPFQMVSAMGCSLFHDMGFTQPSGKPAPGISAFHKLADGTMVRTGSANFGPGDEFCAVWPMFDLLAEGTNGWEPKYRYETI